MHGLHAFVSTPNNRSANSCDAEEVPALGLEEKEGNGGKRKGRHREQCSNTFGRGTQAYDSLMLTFPHVVQQKNRD